MCCEVLIIPIAVVCPRCSREQPVPELWDNLQRDGQEHRSADHLQEQADARIREAAQLPDGEARKNALKNAAQLRSYADMKRRLALVPKPKKTTD